MTLFPNTVSDQSMSINDSIIFSIEDGLQLHNFVIVETKCEGNYCTIVTKNEKSKYFIYVEKECSGRG